MGEENVRRAIDDIAAGKMVILVDDEDRENEGDLCMAAEKVTADDINFMASAGRGLICLTLTEDKIHQLGLSMMVARNKSPFQTGFTVSIEAKQGVSTGISAADRATTVRAAVKKDATAEDIVSPGHIFPIRARKGGVLVRTGQTEGSVDLSRLAGLDPSGVICEIMNADGTMARRPQLEIFAKEHNLHIVTIAELIEYRFAHDSLIEIVCERTISTGQWGDLRIVVLRSIVDDQEHMALVKGQIEPNDPTLVRVQSIALPADLIGIALSGGGAELRSAMDEINRLGCGVFVYLVRTEHSDSMSSKLEQVNVRRTSPTYHRVGTRLDLREFGTGAQILKSLGVRKFRLMSNNEVRIVGLEGFDLEMVERVPLPIEPPIAEVKNDGDQ